ncbi:MAG TPA: trypsin-like peptidase domain-containing protein [Gaiellaceae bacterium]|jgi:S1-C subfamily serine protease|nr:trypsin-like peptidase domain-containing protein [Gaiellaceae bacterium]
MDSSILRRAAGLVGAGLLGGALVLGGVGVFGGGLGGRTTTVRELVNSGPSSAPASFQTGRRLSINQIYRRSAPGVVQVTSTSVVRLDNTDPFGFQIPGFPQQETQRALGSGFVIDKAGHIITNYHVIAGARSVEVSFSNHDSMKAKIVGKDPGTDIAVLKVNARSRALTPLTLGNSDAVRVGDAVVAIGNPFGLDRSVTAGIVSALQREIQAPNSYAIDHVIQTDAAINHGNSGGPLLNADGRVIGVNAQIETGTGNGGGGNVGIGFAIPINTVRTVVAQLIAKGSVEHASLGIAGVAIDREIANLFHFPVTHGVLIANVKSGSGAAKAGLRGATTQAVVAGVTWPIGGDLIVKADGVTIGSLERLREVIAAKKPGDTLRLQIYRGTKKMTLDVELGRQ